MNRLSQLVGQLMAISALTALPFACATAQTSVTHEVVGAVDASGTSTARNDTAPDDIGAWFSDAELDQMLAPVALYPDAVLTHVLIAATYPLEIVEAERWRSNNSHLDAEAALNAVQSRDWDESVKALVAFPRLLTRLSEDLQWTRDLGDAFLISEGAVMDRVQVLRQQAYQHGELRSNEHVQVVREQQTIIIEPAVERVVYVPYYDTRVVYGDWRWASYPPIHWDPWYPVSYGPRASVYWGPAVYVTPAFYVSAFHWPRRHVVTVSHIHHGPRPVFYTSRTIVHHHHATRWHHRPDHRRGVGYHRGYQPRQESTSRSTSRQRTINNRVVTARESNNPARQYQSAQRRQSTTADNGERRREHSNSQQNQQSRAYTAGQRQTRSAALAERQREAAPQRQRQRSSTDNSSRHPSGQWQGQRRQESSSVTARTQGTAQQHTRQRQSGQRESAQRRAQPSSPQGAAQAATAPRQARQAAQQTRQRAQQQTQPTQQARQVRQTQHGQQSSGGNRDQRIRQRAQSARDAAESGQRQPGSRRNIP